MGWFSKSHSVSCTASGFAVEVSPPPAVSACFVSGPGLPGLSHDVSAEVRVNCVTTTAVSVAMGLVASVDVAEVTSALSMSAAGRTMKEPTSAGQLLFKAPL